MKFKVGDKVALKPYDEVNFHLGITRENWEKIRNLGKLTITRTGIASMTFKESRYAFPIEGIADSNASKIVITTSGPVTLARLYEGNKVVKSAEAKCNPADTFDFAKGSKLAYLRLMYPDELAAPKPEAKPEPKQEAQEPVKLYCIKQYQPGDWLTHGKIYRLGANGGVVYDDGFEGGSNAALGWKAQKLNNLPLTDYLVPLVRRHAKVGEWVYIDGKGESNYAHGDALPVISEREFGYGVYVKTQRGADYGCDSATTPISGPFAYLFNSEYLVLDGYQPEDKPYNGKVVCVEAPSDPDMIYPFTAGKVYSVTNGKLIDNQKRSRPMDRGEIYRSLDEINADWTKIKFIEYHGEA